MTNFAILTDSCSDLTAPLRERFGVDGYVPGALVYPDGSNHYADLDWKNMTPAQFFGTMKDKRAACSPRRRSACRTLLTGSSRCCSRAGISCSSPCPRA